VESTRTGVTPVSRLLLQEAVTFFQFSDLLLDTRYFALALLKVNDQKVVVGEALLLLPLEILGADSFPLGFLLSELFSLGGKLGVEAPELRLDELVLRGLCGNQPLRCARTKYLERLYVGRVVTDSAPAWTRRILSAPPRRASRKCRRNSINSPRNGAASKL